MPRPSTRDRRRGGFTLVELAVVLVIMGLVGWLFFGSFFKFGQKEKAGQADRDLGRVESALQGLAVSGRGLPAQRGSVAAYPRAGYLPPSLAPQRDPWGQEFLYFAASELTGNGTLPSVLSTGMRVRIYSGTGSGGTFPAADAPLERETSNVAYLILSRGPDSQGQASVTTVGGDTVINLMRPGGPMHDGSGQEYDDLARYGTLEQLRARVKQ